MDKVIQVQIRRPYGRVLIYPINDLAKAFAKLVGRSTLKQEDVEILKSVGFEFEWVPESLDLRVLECDIEEEKE